MHTPIHTPTHANPPAPPAVFPVNDTIHVGARLAQVLAEEVDHLNAMDIKKIGALQAEKQFLTGQLEHYRRIVEKYPHLRETIPSRDRADLEGVMEVLQDVLEENHRRLNAAKHANERIVHAITRAAENAVGGRVYNESAVSGPFSREAISISVNQTA